MFSGPIMSMGQHGKGNMDNICPKDTMNMYFLIIH